MNGNKIVFVVTGSSKGIGASLCRKIIKSVSSELIEVHGIDIVSPPVDLLDNPCYIHHFADVSQFEDLPEISNVDYLVNNAGIQEDLPQRVIDVNLLGVINCTEKYAIKNNHIKSVVNQASVSAHNGAEFGPYVASKGGVLSYTIWTAKQLAPKAVCNSISFGGVKTDLNRPVIDNEDLFQEIMDMTPMKKWVDADEAADIVFNVLWNFHSMTGQDIIIDNGEFYNHKFVWSN